MATQNRAVNSAFVLFNFQKNIKILKSKVSIGNEEGQTQFAFLKVHKMSPLFA
jgi:hypothetical protein